MEIVMGNQGDEYLANRGEKKCHPRINTSAADHVNGAIPGSPPFRV